MTLISHTDFYFENLKVKQTVKENTVQKTKLPNAILTFNNSNSDGKIGFFQQSNKRGDCYLLASLLSISNTTTGAEILKKNITKDKLGNFQITLPGAIAVKKDYANDNKKCYVTGRYTITLADINKARQSGKYSKGDIDVLLYELAFERYRKEVLKTNQANNQQSQYGMAGQYVGNGTFADPLKGGQSNDAIFILTGRKSKDYSISSNSVASISSQSIKSIDIQDGKLSRKGVEHFFEKMTKDPDRYAATFYLKLDNGKGDHGYHALTLSRVDKDKVYFINPWNSKKEFSLSKEGFFKAAYHITIADLKGSYG